MAAAQTSEKRLQLKKGMLMHPFLDGSGIVFFNTQSTVVSSLNVSQKDFEQWLAKPSALEKTEYEKLDMLIEQGFLMEQLVE